MDLLEFLVFVGMLGTKAPKARAFVVFLVRRGLLARRGGDCVRQDPRRPGAALNPYTIQNLPYLVLKYTVNTKRCGTGGFVYDEVVHKAAAKKMQMKQVSEARAANCPPLLHRLFTEFSTAPFEESLP